MSMTWLLPSHVTLGKMLNKWNSISAKWADQCSPMHEDGQKRPRAVLLPSDLGSFLVASYSFLHGLFYAFRENSASVLQSQACAPLVPSPEHRGEALWWGKSWEALGSMLWVVQEGPTETSAFNKNSANLHLN